MTVHRLKAASKAAPAFDNVLHVKVRNNYGQNVIYPANVQAEKLAKLVGTKTLTLDTLWQAQAMGFTIVRIEPTHTELFTDLRQIVKGC